jgi:choline kinase
MNILVPMAGLGDRFRKEGYNNIKPLIEVNGKTFIEWSVETLGIDGKFIFVILEEHKTLLEKHLKELRKDCIIYTVPKLTNGTAETCLYAKEHINNDSPLIITNSDQLMEWNSDRYIEYLNKNDPDSNVVTFNCDSDRSSYIELDENGYGKRLTEKEVISDNALVGIHYWKKGKYFVDSAEELINRNIRIKNEYYISLTYNILIEKKLNVTSYKLNENEKYISLGTPNELYNFLDYTDNNIKKISLDKMYRGWFIGNFEPSVHKTKDFEVGYLLHKKGERWDIHYHAHMKEVNLLVKGRMILNNKEINENEIFIIDKNVIAAPTFLEDCYIICIKIPSVVGDKVVI